MRRDVLTFPCDRRGYARKWENSYHVAQEVLEGSSRKYNPCGKRRNHSNSDKLGKAKNQALAVGIFCRDCEHPYNPLVGGTSRGRGYP